MTKMFLSTVQNQAKKNKTKKKLCGAFEWVHDVSVD